MGEMQDVKVDAFEHTCRTGNSSPWPPHATHAWRLRQSQVSCVRPTSVQAHAEGVTRELRQRAPHNRRMQIGPHELTQHATLTK